MSAEDRDFVIERLERKLFEKEGEMEVMSTTLRDSIMRELRNDLKNDLDINNRLNKIEQDVKELSSNISGMMDELLDQKSQLRSLGKDSPRSDIGFAKSVTDMAFDAPAQKPVEVVPETKARLTDSLFSRRSVPNTVVGGSTSDQKIQEARSPVSQTSSGSNWGNLINSGEVNMNIREIKAEEPVQGQQDNIPSEYIVANDMRTPFKRSAPPTPKNDDCEYIVAEEGEPLRRRSETELETVEDRDGEDTVITTTRRRSL
ncbi:hypothetical protein [Methanococcoides burtonii]|uniref:Uncharacterized protein n=1 Tax=Methanococcoides burtonii (strain DSM 6242 / NBRC 107633 / OCM 468 / ACE-M) TaxID=259564 RepID=Q12VW9_METBU|nr:hypothetical protein [Methanococcoides burtonii]ABE52407.1 Hypothetical protein Mbur_1500 [Methanococcoides burtonii DSM 6242]